MKIKVCGMREAENIRKIGSLPIDYMGFIFYPPSPRFVGNEPLEALKNLPPTVRKTGVFVSESMDIMSGFVEKCALEALQLHGREAPDDCFRLKKRFPDLLLIKAFPIATPADFLITQSYTGVCDYFLFDAQTPQYGGSGRPFDWSVLAAYSGATPFFLSGGIGATDAASIQALQHPMLYGVDLNSRFEIRTGIKDVDLLFTFINTLKR
jgi:phosphoribosylanthranilate isomerase